MEIMNSYRIKKRLRTSIKAKYPRLARVSWKSFKVERNATNGHDMYSVLWHSENGYKYTYYEYVNPQLNNI